MARRGIVLWSAALSAVLVLIAAISAPPARDALGDLLGDDRRNDLVAAYSSLTARETQTADLTPMPHIDGNPYAINVFLEQEVEEWKIRRTLEMARDAGFHWIKQQVRWFDIEGPTKGQYIDTKFGTPTWPKYDRIVDLTRSYGLELIFRLDTSPEWARPGNPKEESPPDNFEDFGDYVYDVVSRYKGRVRYYQIWNEPNLAYEWGGRPPDARAYVRLLAIAYQRAKAADPDCVVISAALAPTVEISERATNDLVFLQQMYDAGAGQWFDVMSVNPYGLRSGPDDRRLGDGSEVNFSRPILVRELMVRNGDAGKPIWAAELGWNALPPDFPGEAPWGRVSRDQQARYTVRAYQRMQEEWPWMGVAALWHFRMAQDVNRDKPQYYFGIVENDFTPFPVYEAMKGLATADPVVAPGYRQESQRGLTFSAGWRRESDGAASLGAMMVSSAAGETLDFTFLGSDLDIVVRTDAESGRLAVRVDGGGDAANRLPHDEKGQAYVDLWSAETHWQRQIAVARGLPWGRHTVTLRTEAGPQGGTTAAIDALVIAGSPPNLPRTVAAIALPAFALASAFGLSRLGTRRRLGAAALRLVVLAAGAGRALRRLRKAIRLTPFAEPAPDLALERCLRARPLLLTLALAIPVLVAWALRVFRLDAQSLWYDEGITAALAGRDVLTITADAARDIQPPLYYYVVHWWTALAGNGEFALRFPSALHGVLVTALTYQLGRRLLGPSVGWAAALLMAISPLMVQYSQEARMHLQMAMLATLSLCLFVKLISSETTAPGRRHWIAYLIVTEAMLYSHYFSFAVVLAQNIYFLALWLARERGAPRTPGLRSGLQAAPYECRPYGNNSHLRQRRASAIAVVPVKLALGRGSLSLAGWLMAQGLLVLLYLPWLAVVYGQLLGYPGQLVETMHPATLLHNVFRAFTFGVRWDAVYTPRRELALVLLFLAAPLYLLAGRPPRWRRHALLLLVSFLTPLVALYALSLQRPVYQPRYLLTAVPAFYILGAAGVVGLCRAAAVAVRLATFVHRPALTYAIAALVAVTAMAAFIRPAGAALATYYFDARYARDDYRGLAAYVRANALPGDAIVLNAPGQSEIFDYYYGSVVPRYPLPRQRPIDEATTAADLEAIARDHSRVWLVLWAVAESDPGGLVEGWLDRRGLKELDRPFGTVRLLRYDLGRPPGSAAGVAQPTPGAATSVGSARQ